MQTGKIRTDADVADADKMRGKKPIQIDMGIDEVKQYIGDVAGDLGRARGNRTHHNSSRAMLRLLAQAERKLSNNYGAEIDEETKQA